MSPQSAVGTGEVPASRFGDLVPTATAGRRRAPFVDQDDLDARRLGFVFQDSDELSHPPVAGGQVLPGSGVFIENPTGVPHHQGADPVVPGEVDDGRRPLVASLSQTPVVATFEDSRPG
jgi:hypothetical protein